VKQLQNGDEAQNVQVVFHQGRHVGVVAKVKNLLALMAFAWGILQVGVMNVGAQITNLTGLSDGVDDVAALQNKVMVFVGAMILLSLGIAYFRGWGRKGAR